MADKLSESIWSSFTKKNKLDLDDGALIKALAKFDKTDEAKPEPRIDALKDVADQIKKLVAALVKKKKELGDKPFNEAKDKLYDLLEAAEALEKETRQQQQAAAEDEEADSPALLTSAMVPLVRQLQKGEVQMHALIASAGKKAAVLIMRRPVSASRRKLLAEYLGETGGVKYFKAECAGGKGQLEFLLDSSPAGLSKKLRGAIFEQTGVRTKVFVQFGDETETDGDEEEAGQDEAEDITGETTPGPQDDAARAAYAERLAQLQPRYDEALRAQHPESTKLRAVMGLASDKADGQQDYAAAGQALAMIDKLLGTAGPDPASAFKARLTELLPLIKGAAAAAHPAAQDIKLKASEAGVLAGKKDFERANALLDEADALLRQPQAPGTSTPTTPSPTSGAISPTVAFTQARLAWDQTRKKVQSDLHKLEAAILAQCAAEPDAADIASGTKNLYTLLESLDERLIDKLDEALNAADPAQRKALHGEARTIVDEYLAFVASDKLMQDIDNNGFETTSILPAVNASLKLISTRLAAAQAG